MKKHFILTLLIVVICAAMCACASSPSTAVLKTHQPTSQSSDNSGQSSLTDAQIRQIQSLALNLQCFTTFSNISEVPAYKLLIFSAAYAPGTEDANSGLYLAGSEESSSKCSYYRVSEETLKNFLVQVFGSNVPTNLQEGAQRYAYLYGGDLVRYDKGAYLFLIGDDEGNIWYKYKSQKCVGNNDIALVFDYYTDDYAGNTKEHSTMTLHVSLTNTKSGWIITSQKFSDPAQNDWTDAPEYYEGQVVVDLKAEAAKGENKTAYKGYIFGNTSGYRWQCTSYAALRCKAKLGISKLIDLNYGGDVTKAFVKYFASGKSHTFSGSGGSYDVHATEFDINSSDLEKEVTGVIQPNSLVSFTDSGQAGHVVFVEDVCIEGNEKYIYFSEGGEGIHANKKDGIIVRMTIAKFVKEYNGCNGVVIFLKED